MMILNAKGFCDYDEFGCAFFPWGRVWGDELVICVFLPEGNIRKVSIHLVEGG